MTNATTIKALRSARAKSRSKVEDGTIVRFGWKPSTDATCTRVYRFTAVFIAATNAWYLTGTGTAIGRRYTAADFNTEVLASANIVDAEVATTFESLEK